MQLRGLLDRESGLSGCEEERRSPLSSLLEATQLCQASESETKAKLQFCKRKGFSPLRIVQW